MAATSKRKIQESNKPRVPLSAYNIYFKVMRRRILRENDHIDREVTPEEIQELLIEHRNKKGKRLHRRTHGKVGFRELTTRISGKWKKADSQTLKILSEFAAIEKEKYYGEMLEWNKKQERQNASDGHNEQRKETHCKKPRKTTSSPPRVTPKSSPVTVPEATGQTLLTDTIIEPLPLSYGGWSQPSVVPITMSILAEPIDEETLDHIFDDLWDLGLLTKRIHWFPIALSYYWKISI